MHHLMSWNVLSSLLLAFIKVGVVSWDFTVIQSDNFAIPEGMLWTFLSFYPIKYFHMSAEVEDIASVSTCELISYRKKKKIIP